MTDQQLDTLRNGTIERTTESLAKGESMTIDRYPRSKAAVSTVRHRLDTPISLEHNPDSEESRDYDHILMTVEPRKRKGFEIKLSLAGTTDEGFNIIEAGPDFSQVVIKGDYQTVAIGDTTYVFRNEDGMSLQVMRITTPDA